MKCKPRVNCRARRVKLGLTQAQAGARIKPKPWPQNRWSAWENGLPANPGINAMQAVAEVLELEPITLAAAIT